MTTQHTAGPWKARKVLLGTTESPEVTWAIEQEGHMLHAVVQDRGHKLKDTPEAEANARLIAAVPELLEALIGLHNCSTGAEWQTDKVKRQWHAKASKAIAKATGKE